MIKRKNLKKTEIYKKGVANTGTIFIVLFLLVIITSAFMMIGGQLPGMRASNPSGQQIIIITPTPQEKKDSLQLLTFYGITPTPLPTSAPSTTHGCQGAQFNTEPEILVGSDPGPGGTANTAGTIRVWVNDEGAPYIAPNEVVDAATGNITTPGDRTAVDTGTDGDGNYLWEPTLYVIPADTTAVNNTFCNAKTSGCTPHFPNIIKGQYSTADTYSSSSHFGLSIGSEKTSVAVDDYTNFENGPNYLSTSPIPMGQLYEEFTDEYIWNVSSLGLQAGTYQAQFVIHDGDRNLAIDCLNIKI
jgi:hypothetical protein